MKTRIKICGITRVEDALAAARAGADAIGLVFYAASPRAVDIEQARKIVYALPPFIDRVGLFVDAEPDFVRTVLNRVPLSCLQFHGAENAHYCESFGLPYIKVIRMRPGTEVKEAVSAYASASGVLLDSYQQGKPGGTGEVFDWTQVPTDLATPVILAGGLNSKNVVQAVKTVSPYGVDVSGGVEKSKGIKDAEKIVEFIRGVTSVS